MPIVEMYLLIEVAGYIDALPTIGLVMLTAVIGVALLKRQGLQTLTRGTQKMNRGQMPVQEVAEGLLLAVAGALLITPGFVTDGIGFFILFPPTRLVVAQLLLSRVQVQGFQGGFQGSGQHDDGSASGTPESQQPTQTLEGEYQRKDD
jgi:UPF0716 protein FxsA